MLKDLNLQVQVLVLQLLLRVMPTANSYQYRQVPLQLEQQQLLLAPQHLRQDLLILEAEVVVLLQLMGNPLNLLPLIII